MLILTYKRFCNLAQQIPSQVNFFIFSPDPSYSGETIASKFRLIIAIGCNNRARPLPQSHIQGQQGRNGQAKTSSFWKTTCKHKIQRNTSTFHSDHRQDRKHCIAYQVLIGISYLVLQGSKIHHYRYHEVRKMFADHTHPYPAA